jgi:hypothetical protein
MRNRMLKKSRRSGLPLRRDAPGCEHTPTFLQLRPTLDLIQYCNNQQGNRPMDCDIVVYLPIIRL